MGNNFYRFIRNYIGIKLIAVIAFTIVLPIIIVYQLIISLFIPCFYNIMILLIEYLIHIGLIFFVLFC